MVGNLRDCWELEEKERENNVVREYYVLKALIDLLR
jgi:hypothetical protein